MTKQTSNIGRLKGLAKTYTLLPAHSTIPPLISIFVCFLGASTILIVPGFNKEIIGSVVFQDFESTAAGWNSDLDYLTREELRLRSQNC
jgi:hypothetical protein